MGESLVPMAPPESNRSADSPDLPFRYAIIDCQLYVWYTVVRNFNLAV